MSDPSHDELLKILEARGQQFLQNFTLPSSFTASKHTAGRSSKKMDESEEEWGGIEYPSDYEDGSEEDSGSDFEQEDDDFVAESEPTSITDAAPVVVFTRPSSQAKEKYSADKALMKSFMSSKISKTRNEPVATNSLKRPANDSDDEERSNAQHDTMLHKLIHTKLLSGSLDPNLTLTGAERRKALAGRVLELTGSAKMGKGEHIIRADEHRRASKRVREGIADKKRSNQEKRLEEAKNLGNYHPALKKLFEASSSGPARKREQGMKMGVGKFKNGSLLLNREDFQKIQGGPPGTSVKPSRRRR